MGLQISYEYFCMSSKLRYCFESIVKIMALLRNVISYIITVYMFIGLEVCKFLINLNGLFCLLLRLYC